MKLLLSGGGNPEHVVPLDKLFANLIDLHKPVLYIPVAMGADRYSYEECLRWFKTTYKPYGINKIEMCTDLKLAPDLSKYTAVFIGGGNTFKLLKEIKESKFDEKLVNYLNNGGFVYGGSAGAVIFGKTIKTVLHLDKNNVNLINLTGLNLLGGRDVWVHYLKKDDKLIKNYDNNLYILYEDSGIFIDNDKIESVGKKFINK